MEQFEVQELIELTPKQKKAWRRFEAAVRACEKENIHFYQVLDSIGALNGNNVKSVECDKSLIMGYGETVFDEGYNLNLLDYPRICVCCAFADDDHYVTFRNGVSP